MIWLNFFVFYLFELPEKNFAFFLGAREAALQGKHREGTDGHLFSAKNLFLPMYGLNLFLPMYGLVDH